MNKNKRLLGILLFCLVMNSYGVTHRVATMIDPAIGGTISSAGSYYLDWDVTGTITITTSHVTLNLNEHTVFGPITIDQNLRNVSISSGVINPLGNGDRGITIQGGCDLISLTDLTIRNAQYGIYAPGTIVLPVTNLLITRVTAEYSLLHGYFLTECSGDIVNCSAYNNGVSGFNCAGLTSILVIKNSESLQNGSAGIHFYNIPGGLFYCININATDNGLDGILSDAGNSVVCEYCYLNNNQGSGFKAFGTDVTASYCTVLNNEGWGFYLSAGSNISNILITNSLAQHNNMGGFFFGAPIPEVPILGLVAYSASIFNTGPGFEFENDDDNSMWFLSNYAIGNLFNSQVADYFRNGAMTGNGDYPYFWQFSTNTTISRWYNIRSP